MCTDFAKELGGRIAALRQYRGMFQEDLAQHCGFSRQYLSKIESGRHVPSITQLNTIASKLQCLLHINLTLKEMSLNPEEEGE